MEGPSLKIACEELRPFLKKRIVAVRGTPKVLSIGFRGKVFRSARSWGKHLLLTFDDFTIRIHFLMFGSYRIDDPRPNRIPKLELRFSKGTVYFYSCAIKCLEEPVSKIYDVEKDLMSSHWNARKALSALRDQPDAEVADVLMDQEIFAGLGNIIKNEVLFRRGFHPQSRVKELTSAQQRALVKDAHVYSWIFYEWKKKNELKRHWQIFRKRKCPVCGSGVKKRKTGKLDRVSHYCLGCQSK